jgi:hypothetical protein
LCWCQVPWFAIQFRLFNSAIVCTCRLAVPGLLTVKKKKTGEALPMCKLIFFSPWIITNKNAFTVILKKSVLGYSYSFVSVSPAEFSYSDAFKYYSIVLSPTGCMQILIRFNDGFPLFSWFIFFNSDWLIGFMAALEKTSRPIRKLNS